MPLTPVLPCHGPPNGSDVPPLRNRYIGWSVKVPAPWSVLVSTGAPLLTVRRAMSLVMSPSVMTTALCGELKLVLSVVATTESTSFNSPHKAVVITEGDITNDIARLTVNNGAPVLTSTDQGAGTFTDQPMYLFRRGGTSLPFGGPWHGSTGVKGIRTDSEKRRLSAYYNRNVKGY